jgi:hypothetical protein
LPLLLEKRRNIEGDIQQAKDAVGQNTDGDER